VKRLLLFYFAIATCVSAQDRITLLGVSSPSVVAVSPISILHAYNSRTSLTGLSATTSGAGFLFVTNMTSSPTSFNITGGDTFTKWGCLPTKIASENICIYYIANETSGGHTGITCSGTCTGINIVGGIEVSNQDTSTFIDKVVPCYEGTLSTCYSNGAGTNVGITLTPDYNSEAVYFQATCNGSGSTFTGTGATWTNTITSGNPGASAVTSGYGSVTAAIDSGCSKENGVIISVKGAGASQQCSFDVGYQGVGTEASTGNPTVSANLTKTGNAVVAAGFVVSGFSSVSVGNGTDTFTQALAGTSSASTGQIFMDYLLNNTVAGAVTITGTVTGAHTAAQIGYKELVVGAGCATPTFDTASSVGTGSGVTSATTPSITATANAFEFVYTSSGSGIHVTGVNSPWTCYYYSNTGSCGWPSSVSADGFIQLASGSSTANNMSLNVSGDYQAGIFSLIP